MLDDWIPRDRLLAVAHEQGCSERTLEYWRYRRLFPRPRRDASGGWRYPPAAERHLRRLLHWRERARTLEAVRVALWIEGFHMELDDVRAALKILVIGAATAIRREIHSAGDLSTNIDRHARKLAAMRGRAPFPHVVRMHQEERERAYGYLMALAAGDARELERRRDDARSLERMLGLRSGRGQGLAHLSPLETMLQLAREWFSAERLCAVVDARGAEDYEFVRFLARALLLWMPLLVPLMGTALGSKAVPLVDASKALGPDVPAEVAAALVLTMLVSLEIKGTSPEQLDDLLADMDPGSIDREMLSLITPAAARTALASLPRHYTTHLVEELARSRRAS